MKIIWCVIWEDVMVIMIKFVMLLSIYESVNFMQ